MNIKDVNFAYSMNGAWCYTPFIKFEAIQITLKCLVLKTKNNVTKSAKI